MPAPSLTVPSQRDPVARAASTVIGGPVGRHARVGAHLVTPAIVVLLLTLVTFGLGYAQKSPCRTHEWSQQYQYTRLCYSDIYALYFAENLTDSPNGATYKTPYKEHPVEYPVVIGGLMHAGASVANAVSGPRDNAAARFFDITALMMALSALVVTATSVVVAGRRRPWDAAMVALAPGLLLHGTTNWDLAAVAFAGLGLACWARRRPGLAGMWLGLGVATKLYPVLFFLPLLVLCLRAGKVRAWATAVGGALAVWVPLNAAVYAVAGHFSDVDGVQVADPAGQNAWLRFWSLNRTRVADWDSLWYAAQQTFERQFDTGTLNWLVALSFLATLSLILTLAWMAPRRPRLAPLLFLTLAAFLLTNKVNSPQYTLWLIPLAVAARPRWGAFLAWQAAEVLVLFTRFYYFINIANANEGVKVQWFIGAVVLRDAALIALMGLVVREILLPEEDVVREDGVDDPMGGVLDSAPERVDLGTAWDRGGPRPATA